MITFEQTISVATLASTLAVKLFGFPSQMRKIYKAGNIDGVSVLYFVLAFVTYVLWTVHGVLIRDSTVILGQALGVLVSGILLIVLYLTAQKGKRSIS